MKTLIAPIILLFIFLLQSCATVSELSDPNDLSLGYAETKTENGKTIFKRKRSKEIEVEDTSREILLVSNEWQEVDESAIDFQPASLEMNVKPKKSAGSSAFYSEFATRKGFQHLGIGLGLRGEKSPLEFKLGVSLFSAPETTYAGFDLAMRWYMKLFKNIEPFLGGGLYLGDNKVCEEYYEENSLGNDVLVEDCTKIYLSANYLEAGIQFKNMTLFAREYGIRDAGIKLPVQRLYGIGFKF